MTVRDEDEEIGSDRFLFVFEVDDGVPWRWTGSCVYHPMFVWAAVGGPLSLTTRLLHGNTQWLILTSTPAFIPDFSYPHAR